MAECRFPPCDRPKKTLDYCDTHYQQQRHNRPLRMTKPRVPVTARDDRGRKWCSTCATWKPEAIFAASRRQVDGLQVRCRECSAAIYRSRAEMVRDKMRQYRFNITRAEFDALFASQGHACAVCEIKDSGANYWAVDHDHACCPEPGRSCGKCIRGILCGRCNTGLGQFRDSPELLIRAAGYASRAAVSRGVR